MYQKNKKSITPYSQKVQRVLHELKDTVLSYKKPTSPVGMTHWESLNKKYSSI